MRQLQQDDGALLAAETVSNSRNPPKKTDPGFHYRARVRTKMLAHLEGSKNNRRSLKSVTNRRSRSCFSPKRYMSIPEKLKGNLGRLGEKSKKTSKKIITAVALPRQHHKQHNNIDDFGFDDTDIEFKYRTLYASVQNFSSDFYCDNADEKTFSNLEAYMNRHISPSDYRHIEFSIDNLRNKEYRRAFIERLVAIQLKKILDDRSIPSLYEEKDIKAEVERFAEIFESLGVLKNELAFWKARTFRLLLSSISKPDSQKPKLNEDLDQAVKELLEAIYELRRENHPLSKERLQAALETIFSEALQFSLVLQSQRAVIVIEGFPDANQAFDSETMEEIGEEAPNTEKQVLISTFPSLIKKKDTATFEPLCLYKARVICQKESGGASSLDPLSAQFQNTTGSEKQGKRLDTQKNRQRRGSVDMPAESTSK